jgi:hypothetical protein
MMIKAHWIRKAHRWIGLMFSITVLMSSGSGLIHLWMSRSQPAPPPLAARASLSHIDVDAITVSAVDVMKLIKKQRSSALAKEIHLRQISGQPWYQVFLHGEQKATYVNGVTGEVNDAMDEQYAREIALGALGTEAIEQRAYLTQYNSEYIAIFRILPVYRFDSNDAMGRRVYVSTLTGSVTRATDDQKQWEADLFSNFHKWQFISHKNLRDCLLGCATLGSFFVSILGIWLFFITGKSKRARIGS